MAFSFNPYKESATVAAARKKAEQANKEYKASADVLAAQAAMKKLEANPVAKWTGGTYGKQLQDTMGKLQNREKFTYDLNADALYQQYKDQYMLGGQMAMQDTMGQAAALTGGYGNSYAATAGNQAYQGYLQQLNGVVPELYQMALDRYDQEGQELKDMYTILNQQYESEYGRHRDNVADYDADLQYAANKYFNLSEQDRAVYNADREFFNTQYNNERNYDYGLYSDEYDRAIQEAQLAISAGGGKKTGDEVYEEIPDYMMDYIKDMVANGDDESDIANYIFDMAGGQNFDPDEIVGLMSTYARNYTISDGRVVKRNDNPMPTDNAVDALLWLQQKTGKS